jgi:5'-nucleotidase (lipoprotein e(P4) family)
MRSILSSIIFTSLIAGCTETSSVDDDQGADINDGIRDDDKADGATGIEVIARLRPGTVDTKLMTTSPRQGYIFFAAEGTKVTLEVTQGGSKAGLDTMMKVYGPRLSDGSYPKTLATDDDAGYGKLSKIKDLEITIPGFYLVEVTNGAKATAPANDAKLRLKLSCTGTCDSDLPVAPLGNDIKWFQRAAERRALSLQAYSLATAKLDAKAAANTTFAVVMDIDETTLDNSTIQHERADLGLGFSQAAWTAWVERKAATALPGALGFAKRVRELGGKLVFVSNRLAATECAQTEANLHAQGFEYDGILCKTTTSDKNPRFDSITAGTSGLSGLAAMPIVMFVGDNIQDFPMTTQDIRKQPDAAFAKFGDSFWLLPNPMYGSWEKNLD